MTHSSTHCFVVPAFGESPHLEACLRSLSDQSTQTEIIVATSTPNRHIHALADRYRALVHHNPRQDGIAADWNFALSVASAPWVTLAHQDDVYLPDFACRVLQAVSAHSDAVLMFSAYEEIAGSRIRTSSLLLHIKRALLELGFLGGSRAATRFSKTNALRFGCAIPCPAVTVNVRVAPLRFRTDLKVDLDWAAWLELARGPGAFIYLREILMRHRVHEGSETSSAITTGQRLSEDEILLRSLWPDTVARAILASYRIAYRSNQVSTGT